MFDTIRTLHLWYIAWNADIHKHFLIVLWGYEEVRTYPLGDRLV